MAKKSNFFDDPEPEQTVEQPPVTPQRAVPNIFDDPKPGPQVPPSPEQLFNRPFGELKPHIPSPSERVANWASDLYRGLGADPYTAGRFGRGTRDVMQLTPAAVPLSVADAAHYQAQGDPTNAALSAIGVVPGAAIGKRAITETAPRVLAPNFADTRLGEVFRPGPTSEQLLGRGGAQIQQFGNAPAVYSPQAARSFVRDARTSLDDASMYPGQFPAVYEALKRLEDKANANGIVTRKDVDQYRAALSLAKKGPQAPAAMHAQSDLYDAMRKTGDDLLQRGVENYGGGKRTEMVETILRNAPRAKNPNAKIASDLRSKIQTLEQRPRGYTESEVEGLDKALEAGATREKIGKGLMTYGTGVGTLAPVGALGALAFGHGSPELVAQSVLVPSAIAAAGGMIKRSGSAARRAATEEAGTAIAQRSPFFREAAAANAADRLYYPGSPAQDFVMRNAITQELIRRQRGETD